MVKTAAGKRQREANKNEDDFEFDADDGEVAIKLDYSDDDAGGSGEAKKTKAKAKKSSGGGKTKPLNSWKEGMGLDLKSFYAESVPQTLQIAATSLPLPLHLARPFFFPESFSHFIAPSPTPLNLPAIPNAQPATSLSNFFSKGGRPAGGVLEAKKWWHYYSCSVKDLHGTPNKENLDGKELSLVALMPFRLPQALAGFFRLRSKHGLQYVSYDTHWILYDFESESVNDALQRFIDNDAYFKQKFPLPSPENCEFFGSAYPEIVSAKGKLQKPRSLLSPCNSNKPKFYFIPLNLTKIDKDALLKANSVSCLIPAKDYLNRENASMFRFIVRESVSDPEGPFMTRSTTRKVDYYVDTSQFGSEILIGLLGRIRSSFEESCKGDIAQFLLRKMYLIPTPPLPAVDDIPEPEVSILPWMKRIETKATAENPDDSIHTLSYAESMPILRFGDALLNLTDIHAKLDNIASTNCSEPALKVFGGSLVYSTEVDQTSPQQTRSIFLNLIKENPLSNLEDLSMTPFQKHFLFPSFATLIATDSYEYSRDWEELAKAAGITKIVYISNAKQLDNLTWEDLVFADLIICSYFPSNIDPAEAGLSWAECDELHRKFLGDRLNSDGSNLYNCCADPGLGLAKVQDNILNRNTDLLVKGIVNLQGVYWHRVIYDISQRPNEVGASIFASEWNWRMCKQNAKSLDRLRANLNLERDIHVVSMVTYLLRFCRSVAPVPPPTFHHARSTLAKQRQVSRREVDENEIREQVNIKLEGIEAEMNVDPEMFRVAEQPPALEKGLLRPPAELIALEDEAHAVDQEDEKEGGRAEVVRSSPEDDKLEKLVDIGFGDRAACLAALKRYKGDVDRAANYLAAKS